MASFLEKQEKKADQRPTKLQSRREISYQVVSVIVNAMVKQKKGFWTPRAFCDVLYWAKNQS